MTMTTFNINVNVTTKVDTFADVASEISRLKVTIGILLAKLPPKQRDEFIADLKGLGLNEEASLYSNFNPKV
ncbi:hypothetical protein [Citrobacter sp. S-77]|uniref:hypothetical protein n=1 Tax=Citrobacter sp. S-77 TaxID=1080067 RepID=UPI0005EF4577|nr:hypothetical protein [Citrobacter sp. S-77]